MKTATNITGFKGTVQVRQLIRRHAKPQVGDWRQCDKCHEVSERDDWEQVQTLEPIRHLAPGDCEEGDSKDRCPNCNELSTFQPPQTCLECGHYPCCCLDPAELAKAVPAAYGGEAEA